MEVRGHWQPVDTAQIYATRTTVQTCIRSPGFDSAVVSCCCWSPGPCSSRYQRLSYFSAPLPDPPNWERLLLRKSELKRQRKIENRYLCESTQLLRAKERPNERSKELNLWRPKLIEGAPLSRPLIISISSSSCRKPTGAKRSVSNVGGVVSVVHDGCRKEKRREALFRVEGESHKAKSNQRAGEEERWEQWQLQACRTGWWSVRLSEQIFLSV